MSVLLPVLIPLAGSAALLLLWRRTRWQRRLAVLLSAGQLLAAIHLVVQVHAHEVIAVQVGEWPAPFGITFAADRFGAILALVTAVVGLAVGIYSIGSIDSRREAFGYYPLTQVLLGAVTAAFLTGDLFNLYVWFEVMLMASFVLLGLGRSGKAVQSALVYVTLSLIGSLTFLTATGLLYGATGTLNMAELALVVPQLDSTLATPLAMMFLFAFGLKSAVFPLFAWLPASYPSTPFPLAALFAGLLTKVGVYALARTQWLIFGGVFEGSTFWVGLIFWVSLITMAVGVLGAYAQMETRRILSFHIVSQIGYMTLALAPTALSGGVLAFYMVHHIVVKTNLFLVCGLARRVLGTSELSRSGSMWERYAWTGVLFAIPALSLAGVPPLSGFIAKLALLREFVDGRIAPFGWAASFILVVSILTLLSMAKIWNEVWLKPQPESLPAEPMTQRQRTHLVAPIVALGLITIGLGVGYGPISPFFEALHADLRSSDDYVRAVLGVNVVRP